MTTEQAKKLERAADAMRFLLDAVCIACDERNSDETRINASTGICEMAALSDSFNNAREVFRSIANFRTDTRGA